MSYNRKTNHSPIQGVVLKGGTKYLHTAPLKGQNWETILCSKGPIKFSHKLSLEHIKKPVNCKIINDILAYCYITINDEILKNLINSPRIVINNLDTEGSTTKKIIKDNLGLPSSKIQVLGVYNLTHKNTGHKYVGSAPPSQLALRFSGYFNNKYKYKTMGKILPILNKESFFNFTLEIIPLYNNYSFRSEIVLEQFFLLDPSFNLNTIKVSNNPSGSNAKPLYMYDSSFSNLNKLKVQPESKLSYYDKNKLSPILKSQLNLSSINKNTLLYLYNRDKSVLYFISNKQEYVNKLGINKFLLEKKIDKPSLYLKRYSITSYPNLNNKKNLMTLDGVHIIG
jgi:hypothetical protein